MSRSSWAAKRQRFSPRQIGHIAEAATGKGNAPHAGFAIRNRNDAAHAPLAAVQNPFATGSLPLKVGGRGTNVEIVFHCRYFRRGTSKIGPRLGGPLRNGFFHHRVSAFSPSNSFGALGENAPGVNNRSPSSNWLRGGAG